jgi:hypothetical protein
MIRFLLRSIGFLCLAASFLLVIYDGTKSIAGSAIYITSVQALWDIINAGSLQALRPLMEGRLGHFAWDPAFASFLNSPSSAVLGGVGVVLILLGRKRRPLIGYAR